MIGPGITYLIRGGWGARTDLPRLGYPVAKGRRTHAIFHHTVIVDNDATANLWENLTEVIAKMRQLQTIRPDLGLDVPYNFVIFLMADGTIVVCEGRGIALTGAHTHGHNTDGIGTALQGNFQLPINVVPYLPLISRYLGWLKYGQRLESLGPINGHSDFSATDCPGDNLYPLLGRLTYARKEDDDMTTPEEMQAACEAALKAKASEIRTWAKRGAQDALADTMSKLATLEAKVDAIQSGGGLTYDETVEADKEAHRQGTG